MKNNARKFAMALAAPALLVSSMGLAAVVTSAVGRAGSAAMATALGPAQAAHPESMPTVAFIMVALFGLALAVLFCLTLAGTVKGALSLVQTLAQLEPWLRGTARRPEKETEAPRGARH